MTDDSSDKSDPPKGVGALPSVDPTTHRLEVRYAMPDVWITPRLLGTVYAYFSPRHEVAIQVELPKDVGDFIPLDEPETVRIPAYRPVSENGAPAIGLNVMRVTVTLPGVGTGAQKHALGHSGFDLLQAMIGPSWERAIAAAQDEAQRFLAWVRVLTQQTWLGLAEEPVMQFGRAHLFDAQSGDLLVSYGPTKTARAYAGDRSLSVEASQRLAGNLAAGAAIPTAAAMLADAEHMQQGRAAVDAHRAVLAAAMACEIQLKQVLLKAGPPGATDLTELALSRQSDIGALSSKVAAAITGRNLRDENRVLFDRIRELATTRNGIVHEGQSVAPQSAHLLVVAARQLFLWLESVRPPHLDSGQ